MDTLLKKYVDLTEKNHRQVSYENNSINIELKNSSKCIFIGLFSVINSRRMIFQTYIFTKR